MLQTKAAFDYPGVRSSLLVGLLLSGVILLLGITNISEAKMLQRILVEENNNPYLKYDYRRMPLPERIDNREFQQLRHYVNIQPKPGTVHELETILRLTDWVHSRWQHDPYGRAPARASSLEILSAAEKGERFSCLEYSRVLQDVLRAYGFVSRIIDLQSIDVAYGGLGNAHVAVEVYSDQAQKWIFLDAQWGVYLSYHDRPINVYDYYRLKEQGKVQQVAIRSASTYGVLLQHAANDTELYRAFLGQYLGYLSVDQLVDGQPVNLLLVMQGKTRPMTFQGLPRNGQIFTTDPQDIYFDIDRVTLVMDYRRDVQGFAHTRLEISSDSDYQQKMPEFAAVPDFIITPHNNMPWYAYYEYRVGKGHWQRLKSASLEWHLTEGENKLEVRAVNTAGHAGPVTRMRIRYASG